MLKALHLFIPWDCKALYIQRLFLFVFFSLPQLPRSKYSYKESKCKSFNIVITLILTEDLRFMRAGALTPAENQSNSYSALVDLWWPCENMMRHHSLLMQHVCHHIYGQFQSSKLCFLENVHQKLGQRKTPPPWFEQIPNIFTKKTRCAAPQGLVRFQLRTREPFEALSDD